MEPIAAHNKAINYAPAEPEGSSARFCAKMSAAIAQKRAPFYLPVAWALTVLMNQEWLAIIIPLGLLTYWLAYVSALGSIYDCDENVEPGPIRKVANFLQELTPNNSQLSGAFLFWGSILVFPLVVAGCAVGYFQRQTKSAAKKWCCNAVAVLGLIFFGLLYQWVSTNS